MRTSDLKKHVLHGTSRGFVGDMFVIGVVLFVLFIALPIVTGIGETVSSQVVAQNPQMNATQVTTIKNYSTAWFDNSPDIMLIILYFVMVIVAFIAAGYEGANPAVTLIVGIIFLICAELVSFGLSTYAHAYITQVNYLNIAPHYTLSTYIMDYLPFFNGVLTIAYIIFVIMRREVTVGPGGGSVVST